MAHSICENIKQIQQEIGNSHLVVVSKYRSLSELKTVYGCGHRHLGENRVQELLEKREALPSDIHWHIIGHLQTNKVKYIAPFVHLIHSVDSFKLLKEVNKEAEKNNRTISFLFQMHIAEEETKYGLSSIELAEILKSPEYAKLNNVKCLGLMGMATNTNDDAVVKKEFSTLKKLFDRYKEYQSWDTLSMGMSSDYEIAVSEGSTLVRVGSKIFG